MAVSRGVETTSTRGVRSPAGLSTIAAVSGLIGVAMGAFGAHGLTKSVPADLLAAFQTGVHYQLWHTLALMVIANLWRERPESRLLAWSGTAMLVGIVLFSGSLFALTLTGQRWLGIITPFGGGGLLLGWLLLALDRAKLWCKRT